MAYWRAYEDFRGFVTEPVWELAAEIASDASQQQLIRTTLHHWLLIYQNMRNAWNEIVADRYPLPDFVWPPSGQRFQAGAAQTYEEMEEEIGAFCQKNYGVDFQMFDKVDVNGANAHPLFKWITEAAPGILGTKAVKWNFTKFLVDKNGNAVERFASQTKPEEIGPAIEKLL